MDDETIYGPVSVDDSGALPPDGDVTDEAQGDAEGEELHSDYRPANRFDASAVHHLSGMYQSWFLDYASYVILERAVPHIGDGLKPVQRRILHSMKRMDDGRFNKVANIVGHTMQFHPHGDASIGDALVQLGQKDLLVECQGNWGNILTGDRAAAPRYIEARLSKFALETAFNAKTTEWQLSYDGRNKEPVTLPVKFPLLLAQGAEGIAVGLSSKILPHNVAEICQAAVKYLRGEPFTLYPDFPTGGLIDVSKYADGKRGGSVRVRAKIEKLDSKTIVIREIPFGKTTSTLIDSILKAVEKGKIKARKVDDNTAATAEIQVHIAPGVSADKTIDALYAFTDCEISISPNCCVIEDNKPRFLTVSEVLRHSVDTTMGLLRRELEIRRGELTEQLFFASLERIFIEKRIYKDKAFEEAADMDAAVEHVARRLKPYTKGLVREVTRDDILRLLEIKMQRILKFSKDKADNIIAQLTQDIAATDHRLAHITDVTIEWFDHLLQKYGQERTRRTEIRNFDTIEAAKVAEANERLYVNRQEGFIGTAMKKDEYVCNCSDIDEVIVFFRDGKFKVVRVADKLFVGKNIMHVAVFKRNDSRTTYNMIYRDGRAGSTYMKRFCVTSVMRDKDYDTTLGTPGTRIFHFTVNPNGEAETVRVMLEAGPKTKKSVLERDFSEIAIKSRTARGNLVTKHTVNRVTLRSRGKSTLGGRKVWFDADILRLNYDGRGTLLGEFGDDDCILVILKNGDYYTTDTDLNNHYEDDILLIEKHDGAATWSALVLDADNGRFPYVKRFALEPSRHRQSLTGANADSKLVLLTKAARPMFRLSLAPVISPDGSITMRPPVDIDVEAFVAVKGFRAKGKRVCNLCIESAEDITPKEEPAGGETETTPEDETKEPSSETHEADAEPQESTHAETIAASTDEESAPAEPTQEPTSAAKEPETPAISTDNAPRNSPYHNEKRTQRKGRNGKIAQQPDLFADDDI